MIETQPRPEQGSDVSCWILKGNELPPLDQKYWDTIANISEEQRQQLVTAALDRAVSLGLELVEYAPVLIIKNSPLPQPELREMVNSVTGNVQARDNIIRNIRQVVYLFRGALGVIMTIPPECPAAAYTIFTQAESEQQHQQLLDLKMLLSMNNIKLK